MKAEQIQTNLRIPDTLYERVKKTAVSLGISRNSAILVLIDMGFKTWKAGFISQKKS